MWKINSVMEPQARFTRVAAIGQPNFAHHVVNKPERAGRVKKGMNPAALFFLGGSRITNL